MMEYTCVSNTDISDHLQKLLKDKSHEIILAVPIESCHLNRKRHLVVISAPAKRQKPLKHESVGSITPSRSQSFNCNSGKVRASSAYIKMARNSGSMDLDYCLLGVDTFMQEGKEIFRLGFVLKLLWGTEISLDGDGGFGIHLLAQHYMFKPHSLQSLWTTIQSLHAISTRLKPKRNFISMVDLDWVRDYQDAINSPQSCINEWNEMPDILSHRPPSPDELSVLSDNEATTEEKKTVIRSKLREIMKTVDLDEITSKSIRLTLEKDLNQKLEEFKPFIDEEILLILGQMDPASEIFSFMYLGSEWNASNLEELNANGITHIMNVTREIDNFFPAVFKYLNIREYDVEETDLLKYWDETYNFVINCLQMGGRVLIHCKMGISRSASTVCAFAMKHFGWSLGQSLQYTKERRSIINPNQGFRHQLSVYEGILQASRQRKSFRKSHRSKSESFVQPKNALEDNPGKEDEKTSNYKRVHCYSKLATYLTELQETLPISMNAKSPDSESYIPEQTEGDVEVAGVARCPAKSHLNQCTCNLELELRVSEKPVDLFEETPETSSILQNLGNFPIHLCHTETWKTTKQNCPDNVRNSKYSLPNTEDIRSITDSDFSGMEKDVTKPESGIIPVLSVKTLAEMFDFRLVSKNIENINKKYKMEDKIPTPVPEPGCTEC